MKQTVYYIIYATLLITNAVFAQNEYQIEATLNLEKRTIQIRQEMVFSNQSKDTLNQLYLNDWMHGYANRESPLAKRFAEEFDKSLHLTGERARGYTDLFTVSDGNFDYLNWERIEGKEDIIKLQLNYPIYPGGKFKLHLVYEVKIPDSRFTKYGIANNEDIALRYWHLSFPIYKDGKWVLSSNKDLDDIYVSASNYNIKFTYPDKYELVSALEEVSKDENQTDQTKTITLSAEQQTDIKLFLRKENNFINYETDKFSLITDMDDKDLSAMTKGLSIDKMAYFLDERLGSYPHKTLLASRLEYSKNPVYGLNQLPSFLRPFSDEFLFEITLFKILTHVYLEHTLLLDPRKDAWVTDALQTYLMIEFVDEFYPDMKLAGNLSKIWGFRSYNIAKMSFNDQYSFVPMLMERQNLDQSLTTAKDSLIKFNHKIANKAKAGIGLKYLESYLNDEIIQNTIKNFYKKNKLKQIGAKDFESAIKKASPKNIDWFFEGFLNSRKRIDFKIDKVKKTKDSLFVTIKNKRKNNVPITLFTLKNDSIVSKIWLEDVMDKKTISISRKGIDKLVLNYDKIIPEFNQRDNWRSLKGFFFNNKPFQFRFLRDVENPHYNQIFYIPEVGFNIYDGITPSIRISNKTIKEQAFIYNLKPAFGLTQQALVGSGSLSYTHNTQDDDLYFTRYSVSGSSFHFAEDSRFISFRPSVSFGFRTKDMRSNRRSVFSLRNVFVKRQTADGVPTEEQPDYNVLNARYILANPGAVRYFSFSNDLQISNNFAKVSMALQYRKLFKNNRQFNLRFFAGKFIYNDTPNSDFFSFGVSQPNDYFFDLPLLGRSEDSGIFSQQFVLSQGGFKSKFNEQFSNNFIFTTNASYSIWRYIEAYGDLGYIKNSGVDGKVLFDTGIRLNLLEDYFELYFPLYSSNGWEPGFQNYEENIRFVVSLDPKTLIGLFTRKWF